MGEAQPIFGFLGEAIEKSLAVTGGACVGFFTGGPLGAISGGFSGYAVADYRWFKARMEDDGECAKKTHQFVMWVSLPVLVLVISSIGYMGFHVSARISCANDLNAPGCIYDMSSKNMASVAFLISGGLTGLIWLCSIVPME